LHAFELLFEAQETADAAQEAEEQASGVNSQTDEALSDRFLRTASNAIARRETDELLEACAAGVDAAPFSFLGGSSLEGGLCFPSSTDSELNELCIAVRGSPMSDAPWLAVVAGISTVKAQYNELCCGKSTVNINALERALAAMSDRSSATINILVLAGCRTTNQAAALALRAPNWVIVGTSQRCPPDRFTILYHVSLPVFPRPWRSASRVMRLLALHVHPLLKYPPPPHPHSLSLFLFRPPANYHHLYRTASMARPSTSPCLARSTPWRLQWRRQTSTTNTLRPSTQRSLNPTKALTTACPCFSCTSQNLRVPVPVIEIFVRCRIQCNTYVLKQPTIEISCGAGPKIILKK
jgi:hypothetical protein